MAGPFSTLGDLPALRDLARRLGVTTCRKHRHASRGAAEAQVRSILRRDRDARPADAFRPYRCPACERVHGGEVWHVGHAEGDGTWRS